MANQNDSFIDEVTDDLRRDRLFAAFRRYGWIGVLLIVLIVGGAAFNEYRKAQATAEARAFGDAILAAQNEVEPGQSLAAIDTAGDPSRGAVVGLLKAGILTEGGAPSAAASAELEAVANALGDGDPLLRDLARLKMVMTDDGSMDPAKRDATLADLARPGAPFELLALEQQAIMLVAAGRAEDAMTLIRQIQQKDGLSQGLRLRLSEMMIALGEDPEEASDSVPEAAIN